LTAQTEEMGTTAAPGKKGKSTGELTTTGLQHSRWFVRWSPSVIFFSDAGPGVRWVGNENGIAGETNWNSITPDSLYAGSQASRVFCKPEMRMEHTGYRPSGCLHPARLVYHAKEDSLVKSAEKLFEIYLASVGRGSTLLLNVPPDRRGLIHENGREGVAEMARDDRQCLPQQPCGRCKNYFHFLPGRIRKIWTGQCYDNDKETYWATDDEVTSADLEIDLGGDRTVNYVVLQEYIKLGNASRNLKLNSGRTTHGRG